VTRTEVAGFPGRHMRSKSNRSRFLAGVSTLGAIGIVQAAAPAAQFEYKLALSDPVEYTTSVRMAQMANAVSAETNGRMQIKIYPNSVLGSTASILTQLRLGVIQFYCTNHYGFSALVPLIQIDSVGFAFSSQKQPVTLLDGALGAYIRKEFAAKGMYVFEKTFDLGFRQVTSSTKPIREVGDFTGFKIRVPPAPIFVDLFKTLGASPVPIDSNELYTSLQTHLADGQEVSMVGIESFRTYEVQKYLSVTNHLWVGYYLAANAGTWAAVPPDIQAVVKRNVDKFTVAERKEIPFLNESLADKLKRQGLIFNTPDVSGMRARLGPYYARWKNELGSTAWSLLEAEVGKLG
jgi:TRAP-type transport system periplasmic protein